MVPGVAVPLARAAMAAFNSSPADTARRCVLAAGAGVPTYWAVVLELAMLAEPMFRTSGNGGAVGSLESSDKAFAIGARVEDGIMAIVVGPLLLAVGSSGVANRWAMSAVLLVWLLETERISSGLPTAEAEAVGRGIYDMCGLVG
ncbi:hypothetical protein GGI23_004407 [Coemansia sp. RSA 2559]|nr:hypothetical protein GGI23_004407 [Coemansia sp. RSA 2559]